ncbi:DUF4405 domain-containing protein [Desulfovibrio inopinatus]|uniref:DUF4405 domain-containing protein n=1 Tax=Desulfovibrio inopinatus TaxID=102109 RepID=UPI000403C983|nr:DUF4405 domain-containing protein [Desulfovibrio inopinatus]
MRKITSLTLFLSGFFVILTSVILYLEPHGRVAYWADWTMLGLTKDQWDAMHLTTGFLFLFALLLHIYYNWKPILAYMKNKAKEMVVFTKPFTISLIITLYVAIGTLFQLPPMQQVLDLGVWIKEGHIETYGNPPFGHAELSSLKKFSAYLGLNVDDAIAALKENGVRVESADEIIKDIARNNNLSPHGVFEKMKLSGAVSLPQQAPEGTGRLTIAVFSKQFDINQDELIAFLKTKNITATPEMTFKEAANASNQSPHDVYMMIRAWRAGKE